MAPTPQVFTLEAVNEMLPRLSMLVRRQLARRTDIESLLNQLGELTGDVPDEISPDDDDSDELRALKRDLVARIDTYQDGWREVEAMGAVLKDPRVGLLDFYGRVDDKLVWLCWKYGEEEVTHYHALDEGFGGRKPIGQSVRLRLLN